jgi:hypothetical protein
MGFEMSFDERNNLLRVTVGGEVTDASLTDSYATAAKYVAANPPCRGIWVFSDVTKFEVSTDTIPRAGAKFAHNPVRPYARNCRPARSPLWNGAHVSDPRPGDSF